MRNIDRPKPFRKDFKREMKGINHALLERGGELEAVILHLANDVPLALKYKDHMLHGNWEGFRECHIRSDLLLVY